MSARSDQFVKDWVFKNVHPVPGLGDVTGHAENLAKQLKAEARAQGISADELDETVGDASDYVLNEYEQVHDPDLGGFKD